MERVHSKVDANYKIAKITSNYLLTLPLSMHLDKYVKQTHGKNKKRKNSLLSLCCSFVSFRILSRSHFHTIVLC